MVALEQKFPINGEQEQEIIDPSYIGDSFQNISPLKDQHQTAEYEEFESSMPVGGNI